MGVVCRVAALCLFCLSELASSAPMQEMPKSHDRKMSSKADLGTSAAVDGQGNLWMASKETTGSGQQYVTLQVSQDMGKTWSNPTRIQREPEPIAADGENRPKLVLGKKGQIYVAYTMTLAKPYTGAIRFVRSLDGGRTFSQPITVHANRDEITHRFESMVVDKDDRIYIAWIDKRDVEAANARKEKYVGAALYYATSEDQGATFKGDYKIADHSCECCRIALTVNADGKPIAFWRHIFEPNARDHALIELTPDGNLPPLVRATFDDWRVDACPHHGPSIAYAPDGTRHQTWFNVKNDEGSVFYASANSNGVLSKPMKLGSAQAQHADVAVQGNKVAVVWKQFDGKVTAILAKVSNDGGLTWQDKSLASTLGDSDQPHLTTGPLGNVLVWRTKNEGVRTLLVDGRS